MAGPTTLFQSGDHASRPAAGSGAVLYWCTDHEKFYRDSGSSWADLADLSGIGGGVTFAGVHAVKTASFPTLTTGVAATLAFDGTDVYDTDAYHDPASNNTRLTVPSGKDGKYIPWAKVEFATNGTSYRRLHLMKNGSLIHLTTAMAHASVGTIMTVTWMPVTLVATDYLELQALQNSGGNLATADQQFGMYLLPGS